MAQLIGAFRLGRDAELRTTPHGDAVCNLALATNYGPKGEDGNRATQWVDASLWGKRAEGLAQYLLKGQQVYVVLQDPHIETYDRNDGGQGSKLVARVLELELVGGRPQGDAQAPAQRQPARQPSPARNGYADAKQRPQPAPQSRGGGGASGFDDMMDDIPFATSSMDFDMETSRSRRMRRYGF